MASYGSYNPMQFSIEFDTDFEEELRNKKLSTEHLAALFHELVHVYQDMATAFCQRSMTIRNNLIASINNSCKGRNIVNLPYMFVGDDIFLKELHDLSLNYRQIPAPVTRNSMLSYGKSRHPTSISPDNPVYEVAECVIVQVNGNEFQLDARIIQECMAAIYEMMLFPASRSFYDVKPYPYLIPVMLARGVVSEISEPEVGLLCELALDYDYPGVVFVEFLENIKTGQLKIEDIRKGFDTEDSITGSLFQTPQERNRQRYDDFLWSLKNVSPPSQPKVFEDIRCRVGLLHDCRVEGKYLYDYVMNPKTPSPEKVYDLLNTLSSVIIFNAGNPGEKYTYVNGRFSYSESSVIYWMLLDKMYCYLIGGCRDAGCPFYSYCHRMQDSEYDSATCQFPYSILPEERQKRRNGCLFAAMLYPFYMQKAKLEVVY